MMKFILLSLLCFGAFANVILSESKGIYTAKINGDYEVQSFVIIDTIKGNYSSSVWFRL